VLAGWESLYEADDEGYDVSAGSGGMDPRFELPVAVFTIRVGACREYWIEEHEAGGVLPAAVALDGT
jgi:hypothetical protein